MVIDRELCVCVRDAEFREIISMLDQLFLSHVISFIANRNDIKISPAVWNEIGPQPPTIYPISRHTTFSAHLLPLHGISHTVDLFIMAANGDLADEPHKTFDTILTLDFGSVTPITHCVLEQDLF
jgi:hypothetical protein